MNGFTPSPTRSALQACGGIILSATVVYMLIHGADIVAGRHYIDWSLVRGLCLIGLLTLCYSFYEVRTSLQKAR